MVFAYRRWYIVELAGDNFVARSLVCLFSTFDFPTIRIFASLHLCKRESDRIVIQIGKDIRAKGIYSTVQYGTVNSIVYYSTVQLVLQPIFYISKLLTME